MPARPLPTTGRETGIDVGLKVFLITADGDAIENPRHYRRAEKQLAKAQRRVSRRKKGSKRRGKTVGQLQLAHQTVQRQRADFHHKTALALLRDYDTISLEDLRVANLVRNRHLATSISDAGWAQFRSILEAKAACAGRRVVAVPPAYTSQDCSGCGVRIPKSLSVRTHVFTNCGLMLDRDENAARNIHWAGQALRGVVGTISHGTAETACSWVRGNVPPQVFPRQRAETARGVGHSPPIGGPAFIPLGKPRGMNAGSFAR